MKRSMCLIWLVAGLLTGGSAQAEFNTNLVAGFNSAYLWRAVNYSKRNRTDSGMFHGSLNFSGALTSQMNWNATLWAADFGNDNFSQDLQRGKIQAGVSRQFENFSMEAGLIRYWLVGITGTTSEFYVNAATSYGGLDYKSTLFCDIEYTKGGIFSSFAVSKGFDIAYGARFTIEANYNGSLSGCNDSYYSYGLVAAVRKQLSERVTGRAYFAGEITEGHAWDGDDLYGGMTLTFAF